MNEIKAATVSPDFYTGDDLACRLQLSRKTIVKWTQEKRIPGQLKCGGRWRYSKNAVERAMNSGVLLLTR